MQLNTEQLSEDMARILSLPIMPLDTWGGWPVFDSLYKSGNADDSEFQLNIPQRMALSKLIHARGLIGLLPVGWGKTLIGLLAPTVLKSARPVYLTKSKNVETVYEEWRKFRDYFHIVDNLKVYGYEGQLSRAEFATLLADYKPDLVVGDEIHYIANKSAARSMRLIRFFQEAEALSEQTGAPMPVLVAMSGTLTKRSIKDYEHIARIALRANSPLPFNEGELSAWASVLDAGMDALLGDFSKLKPLAAFNNEQSFGKSFGQFSGSDIQGNFREAFRRRLHSCPGVVATEKPSVECSLTLSLWETVQIPQIVDDEISRLNADPVAYGLLPPTDVMGPDQYQDYMDNFIAEKTNQLMHGFYYTFDWPGGTPDMEYVNARSVWAKNLALELGAHAKQGYDSPFLIVQAIEAGKVLHNQDLCAAWYEWKAQKDKPEPPQKITWVSDYLIKLVSEWLNEPGIVWTQYDAFGQRFMDYYGAGDGKPTSQYAVASVAAHGTGHNLQHYQRGLVLSPILSAAAWEQLLGRWHRQGQSADEVSCDILLHTDRYKRKWQAALKEAEFIEQTTGQQQKILYANKIKEKGVWMK